MGEKLRGRVQTRRVDTRSVTRAAGALFYSRNTDRFLLLLRSNVSNSGTWGIAGGKSEPGETEIETVKRETEEELGFLPSIQKVHLLDNYSSSDGKFNYVTYVFIVNDEFRPMLNDEHSGYAWVSMEAWPTSLHPGLRVTVDAHRKKLRQLALNLT